MEKGWEWGNRTQAPLPTTGGSNRGVHVGREENLGGITGKGWSSGGRPLPRSPGNPQCSPAHHVLRQAWQEALVQDLCRDLLHFFFPLVPGETTKPHTRSCHQHRGPGSALGSPISRAGYPQLLPKASPHPSPSAQSNCSSLPSRANPSALPKGLRDQVPPSSQPRSFVSSSCPHSPQRAGSAGTHPPYALAPPRLTCTCAAQGESRGSHHRLPPSMPPAPAWSHLLFKSLSVIPVPVVTDVDGRGGSSWPYLWDNPSTKGMRPIKKGAQPAWETSNGMKNYGHSQQRAEQVGEGSGKCTTGPDL